MLNEHTFCILQIHILEERVHISHNMIIIMSYNLLFFPHKIVHISRYLDICKTPRPPQFLTSFAFSIRLHMNLITSCMSAKTLLQIDSSFKYWNAFQSNSNNIVLVVKLLKWVNNNWISYRNNKTYGWHALFPTLSHQMFNFSISRTLPYEYNELV